MGRACRAAGSNAGGAGGGECEHSRQELCRAREDPQGSGGGDGPLNLRSQMTFRKGPRTIHWGRTALPRTELGKPDIHVREREAGS